MTTQAEKDAAVAAAKASIDALAALVVVAPGVTPTDCVLSAWGPWSACVNGTQTRSRTIVTAPANGGAPCGPLTETQACVVIPPIPIPQGLLPSIGSASSSLQLNFAPADWIDTAKLPQPVPWTLPNTLAPSQNGVRPDVWWGFGPYGVDMHLYSGLPLFKAGRIIQKMVPHHSDVVIHAQLMHDDPPPVGARGVGFIHPITTWHGHPAAGGPLYFGIRADGAFIALMPDGTSKVFGWVPAKAPLDFSYTDTGKVFLTANTEDGKIIKTDRTAALAVSPEDTSLWVHTDLATGLGRVTGVRWTPFGTFACAGGHLLQIAADGSHTTLGTFASAFALDYTSTGKLVVLTSDITGIYIVDPVTGATGPNLTPSDVWAGVTFGVVCVDKNGTVGPKDSIYFTRSQGRNNGNETFCLYASTTFTANPFGDLHPTNDRNGGWLSIGDMAFTFETMHYPWAIEVHPIHAMIMTQGTANLFPKICRPRLASDPPTALYDNWLFGLGLKIHKAGVFTAPVGSVPSFACQMNCSGWSNIGVSADGIAESIGTPKDYAKLAAVIQNGLYGSFKRPDIVGYGLKAYGSFLIWSSQRYLKEGAPLLTEWWTWCDQHSPGPVVPPDQWPSEPFASTTNYLEAFQDGAGLSVRLRDKDFGDKVIPPATSIKIVADKGMPFEKLLGTVTTPWKLASYSLPAGPHSITCEAPGMFSKAVLIEA